MACFLVSYRPLACANVGRQAASTFSIPPYVDGSCRREPDLESPRPSITALCRAHMFVPRLAKNDEVVYITVRSTFGERGCRPHHRLVAHLRVIHLSASHDDAAKWYSEQSLPVPSNCMIQGSRPVPYEHTNGRNDKSYQGHPVDARLRNWDGEYRKRARNVGLVAHCEPLYLNILSPPRITVDEIRSIFGRVPGTQTPATLPCDLVRELVRTARRHEGK